MEPTKDGLYKFDEMNFYVLESMDDLVRVIDSNKNRRQIGRASCRERV